MGEMKIWKTKQKNPHVLNKNLNPYLPIKRNNSANQALKLQF